MARKNKTNIVNPDVIVQNEQTIEVLKETEVKLPEVKKSKQKNKTTLIRVSSIKLPNHVAIYGFGAVLVNEFIFNIVTKRGWRNQDVEINEDDLKLLAEIIWRYKAGYNVAVKCEALNKTALVESY